MVRAWRIFGLALIIVSYFLTAPIGYGLFAIWWAIPSRDPRARARRIQSIMEFAFRLMHKLVRWMWILDFDPRHNEGAIPTAPCVIVANHPTLTDISALLASERNLVFPVKPSLFRSFWAKPVLAQADHFEGASPEQFTAAGVIDSAVDRLSLGYRVMIFPEGTRSPENGLHPFGRTAFEIAVRADVPVVPVVITCTPRWLWKNQGLFNPPITLPRLRLKALPAVHPRDAGSSSRTLRDMVFDRIRSEVVSTSETNDYGTARSARREHGSID